MIFHSLAAQMFNAQRTVELALHVSWLRERKQREQILEHILSASFFMVDVICERRAVQHYHLHSLRLINHHLVNTSAFSVVCWIKWIRRRDKFSQYQKHASFPIGNRTRKWEELDGLRRWVVGRSGMKIQPPDRSSSYPKAESCYLQKQSR